MRNLTEIDAWISPFKKSIGSYKNSSGKGLCGTYIREYKDTYEVIILNHGHLRNKYKYPKKLNIQYKNTMSKWQNLYVCGGFTMTDANGCIIDEDLTILKYVIERQKPLGFIRLTEGKFKNNEKQIKDSKIHYDVQKDGSVYTLGIANNGTIGEVFDLDGLAKTYKNFAEITGYVGIEQGIKYVKSKANDKLSELIINDGINYGYYYANPKTIGQYIFTGLTLGYPIESTIGKLYENKFIPTEI